MSAELQAKLDALEIELGETEAGIDSAVVFIQGMGALVADLRAQLAAGGATPEQLALVDAFGARLDAKQASLAAAMAANPIE